MCTDQINIKEFATKVIKERNESHEKVIKEKDNVLHEGFRDIELKLQKWRLKERKHDFAEKI
jgi:hypothetical protein